MPTYKAPVRDISFVVKDLFGLNTLKHLPNMQDVSEDLFDTIVNESARFAEHVLFPLNQVGDEEGCTWENGNVKTPKGFKEAYKAFVEAGWPSLSNDPKYGGQGLPHIFNQCGEEMVCSANLSFGLYPGLTRGSSILLSKHGTEELKEKYLYNLSTCKWGGTMCLTEPHCGTDLGLIKTKALLQADGSYKLSGTKIFISSGEHDLTENIIHFVLARPVDSPPGIKGVSLFLVPKFCLNGDGSLGERNGIYCSSIEHKMGIKGSATCTMTLEEATGYLVGDLNGGVSKMFTMMNTERLGVGTQGLGISEISYQNALQYARDRLQGRALTGPQYAEKAADPIIVHPDVRRMLLTMKAYTEGNRMLAFWVIFHLDLAEHSPDSMERQNADDFVNLMTPVVKAFLTDKGFECANLGVQIFGGHGYIKDHGMEQYVRDARIAQLYEGTNGIQALDLIGRKMPAHMGRYLRTFFHPVQQFIHENSDNPLLQEFIPSLAKAFTRLQQATAMVAQRALKDPNEAGAAATDFLNLFAHVALAYLWARVVLVAHSQLESSQDSYYQSKIDTARFYYQKLLPQSSALFATIMAGAEPVMGFKEEAFGLY